MTQYAIINIETIQKRIEELEKQLNTLGHTSKEEIHAQGYLSGKIQQLRETLSQSTPLIPEIEKAFEAGENNIDNDGCYIDKEGKQDYISNLKLDI